MKTIEDRLNEIIEQKELEIEELSEKVEGLTNRLHKGLDNWQFHQLFIESELQKKLPIPRVEMRFSRKDVIDPIWRNVNFDYGLVIKPYGCVGDEECVFMPMGSVESSSSSNMKFKNWFTQNGKLDLPLRAGIDFPALAFSLKLKSFVICEEMNYVEECSPLYERMDLIKQMNRS